MGALEVGGRHPDAAIDQPKLEQELPQLGRRVEHLAAVLDVERVRKPAHELEPSGRLGVQEVVDRADGLHVQTLPFGERW